MSLRSSGLRSATRRRFGALLAGCPSSQGVARRPHDPLEDVVDIVEIAEVAGQFSQAIAVGDGLPDHGQREMQAPVDVDLIAIRQRAAQRVGEAAQMADVAFDDLADRRHGFDRGAGHEARGGGALSVGAEAPADRRAGQCPQDRVDLRTAAAGFFRDLQFGEAFAVEAGGAAEEQLRQQLVLGAEVIIDGGEVDVRRGDDVAQADFAETALGVELFGGAQNRCLGLVCGHRQAVFQFACQFARQLAMRVRQWWVAGEGRKSPIAIQTIV